MSDKKLSVGQAVLCYDAPLILSGVVEYVDEIMNYVRVKSVNHGYCAVRLIDNCYKPEQKEQLIERIKLDILILNGQIKNLS